MKRAWMAAAAVAFLCPAVRAQPRIAGVEWQEFVKPGLRAPGKYETVDKLVRPPSSAAAGKLRAVVKLENADKARVEAIDLNFAISVKLRKIGSKDEAVWAVPYRVDGRSIPMLAANQTKAVPIETLWIEPYLKQLYVAGYWPVAIKLELQVRPRSNVPLQEPVSSELPVVWEAPSARP